MLENLITSLFVGSHVWALRKRFTNFTDLLAPTAETHASTSTDDNTTASTSTAAAAASTAETTSAETTLPRAPHKKPVKSKWVVIDRLSHLPADNPLQKAAKTPLPDIQARWFLAPHRSLRLKARLPDKSSITMDIAVSKICAIEANVRAGTFTFQYCAKPKIKQYKRVNDKAGTFLSCGTTSVVSMQVKRGSEQGFNAAMHMLYKKSMQLTTLRELLRTSVRAGLHVGDDRLRSTFFSSSDCDRRGKHTAGLRRDNPEYQVCIITPTLIPTLTRTLTLHAGHLCTHSHRCRCIQRNT